jgi:hypothetical protein
MSTANAELTGQTHPKLICRIFAPSALASLRLMSFFGAVCDRPVWAVTFLTQGLGAAEPQPNWRKTGYWYNSLRDETTNFSYRYRRFASFY